MHAIRTVREIARVGGGDLRPLYGFSKLVQIHSTMWAPQFYDALAIMKLLAEFSYFWYGSNILFPFNADRASSSFLRTLDPLCYFWPLPSISFAKASTDCANSSGWLSMT